MQLPLYGIEIEDLHKIWKNKGQFVPLEDAYVLHSASQLEALGLTKGDPRYDWVVALAQANSARDMGEKTEEKSNVYTGTGFYKGDFWEINIALAQNYLKFKNNFSTGQFNTSSYAARLGGDEFGFFSVSEKNITIYVGDFANLGGLNPALSSTEEIQSDAREALRQELPRRLKNFEDRRGNTPEIQSKAGFARADKYLAAIVQLFAVITTIPQQSNENVTTAAQHKREFFYAIQADFNEATDLHRIERLKKDHVPYNAGTGLAVGTQILDENSTLNPHAWWEAEIKEQKAHCQTYLPENSSAVPLKRVPNIADFSAAVDSFRESYGLKDVTSENSTITPLKLHQVLNAAPLQDTLENKRNRPEIPIRIANSYAIFSEVLMANANAGNAKLQKNSLSQYLDIVNNALNNYLNGAGRVLHLIQDIQSAAKTGNAHLGLIEIGNFSGMNEEFTHKGCDAIRNKLLIIVRELIDNQLATFGKQSNPPKTCHVEVYTKAGARAQEDAGKTGYILHNITEEEANKCFVNVKNGLADYINQHHFNKLPSPKTGLAGVNIYTSVAPIPAQCATRDSARALFAEHHNALNAQKSLKLASADKQTLNSQQSIWQSTPLDSEQSYAEATKEIVSQLIEEYENVPLAKLLSITEILTNDSPRAFACPWPKQRAFPENPTELTLEYITYLVKAEELGGR